MRLPPGGKRHQRAEHHVRTGAEQLEAVVRTGGDTDGERVRVARGLHVARRVAHIRERAAVAQRLGLARSVAPAEDRVDGEADLFEAAVRVRLELRGDDDRARVGSPYELD